MGIDSHFWIVCSNPEVSVGKSIYARNFILPYLYIIKFELMENDFIVVNLYPVKSLEFVKLFII
jgi:hypothetical protein